MASPRTKIGSALRLAAFQIFLVFVAVLLVRREIWQQHILNLSFSGWQEWAILPLAAIDGAITGWHPQPERNHEHSPVYRKYITWGLPIFFVLYVACCALCERLQLTSLREATEIGRWAGILLVVAATLLRLWAHLTIPAALQKATPASTDTDSQKAVVSWAGPYKVVRHPDASARLIALCGLPLVFGCWLPLLAIPGVVVLLKWHISDEEAFRISQLGEPYLEYKKRSWNFLPFLY